MSVLPSPRVDFRFADEGDSEDIVALVNAAYAVERGDSGRAFTTQDRITLAQVEKCMSGVGNAKRWILLETPAPDECIVAALLFDTGRSPGKGHIEVLAVAPDKQGLGLGSQLLRKAEGILINFCCRYVTMRCAHWRDDLLAWGSRRGYRETGGGLWGELDGCDSSHLTRPTRYIVFSRDLLEDPSIATSFGHGSARFTSATRSAAERAAAAAETTGTGMPQGEPQPPAGELQVSPNRGALAPVDGSTVPTGQAAVSLVGGGGSADMGGGAEAVNEGGTSDNMEDLLRSLIRSLNTEDGRQAFRALATREAEADGVVTAPGP